MRTILILLVVACSSKASKPEPNCDEDPTAWCSPPGDPCGEHKDVASCRADPKCTGVGYRGESFAECKFDARGFATNCPTAGCQSIGKH